MSYILEALKKSEQAREGRKSHKTFQESPQSPDIHARTSGSSRRILYLIAFILSLNVAVLVFWAAPWRGSAPPPPTKHAEYKPAQAISREHPAGTHENKTAKPRKPLENKSAPRSPAPEAPNRLAQNQAGTGPQPKASPMSAHHASSAHTATTETGSAAPASNRPEIGKRQPPVQAPPPRRVEVAAKKTSPSLPPHASEPHKTAVDLKAENLKALLEKQAESAEKSDGPASRENSSDERGYAGPDTSNQPDPKAPRLSQLPAQVRETLPDISVSMLIYSKQPANRFIYINGSKRHEGDEISSGLKVERITHDGAILSYMGRRFYKSVLGD